MVFVGSDLKEHDVVSVRYLHTDRFEDFIDFRGKDHSSVLCSSKMVEQDRYIMASVNMLTHAPIIFKEE